MNNIDILKLLESNESLVNVVLYLAKATQADPFEKNTTLTYLNPITIKGLVTPISMESLKWKYFGKLTEGSVEVICNKKYLSMLKLVYKIKIEENEYTPYKDAEKGFMLIEKTDYIKFVAERKV